MTGALSFLRLLFDPRGRMNRSGLLISAVLLLIVEIISAGISSSSREALPVYLLAMKALGLWVAIAGCIKRLHDIDLSAWWLVLGLGILCGWSVLVAFLAVMAFGFNALNPANSIHILAFGVIMLPVVSMAFWLHVTPGTSATNRFGPVQKSLAEKGHDGLVPSSGSQAGA